VIFKIQLSIKKTPKKRTAGIASFSLTGDILIMLDKSFSPKLLKSIERVKLLLRTT
jgi:hypothetical protein